MTDVNKRMKQIQDNNFTPAELKVAEITVCTECDFQQLGIVGKLIQCVNCEGYFTVNSCVNCNKPVTAYHQSRSTGNVFPKCDKHYKEAIDLDEELNWAFSDTYLEGDENI